MRRVFADTSYFFALVNPIDPQHAPAVRWSRMRRGQVVVSEFVLTELGNALSRGADRQVFVNVVRLIRADTAFTIVPASTELFERGRSLFAARSDKEWSLVDCTSFEVMRDSKLTDALTADRHFQQAGFKPLLR
jgi:uncharacterized protein